LQIRLTTTSAPNVLLYATNPSGKLVGVEYVVFGPTLAVAPIMFGQTYHGPMTHGLPRHFELHVWLWLANRDGIFSQLNSCRQRFNSPPLRPVQ